MCYNAYMKDLFNNFFNRDKDNKSGNTHVDMHDVMRRVDGQIGRAVERLSDR